MISTSNESTDEVAALEWADGLAYAVLLGSDIALGDVLARLAVSDDSLRSKRRGTLSDSVSLCHADARQS